MREQIRSWYGAFERAVARVDAERAPSQGVDWQVVGLVILCGFVLSVQEYFGSSNDVFKLQAPLEWLWEGGGAWLESVFRHSERARLWRLSYWSGMTALCYMVLPALYVKLVIRGRLRDFGLQVRGTLRHAWLYVAMYGLVLPAVILVSRLPSFQRTYPFYQDAARTWGDFVGWELLYGLQFLSLEFFFRGVMVQGFRARLGFYAILMPILPYCMIHYGKPLPETLGAIFAGLVLGAMALFTRSIWLGVAIHISVALTMDVLSLWAQGKLVW